MIERKQFPQMFFPGPVDDFQSAEGHTDPAMFSQTLEALGRKQPLNEIPGLVPFIHMAKMSPEHVNQICESLANTPSCGEDIADLVDTLQTAAQVAAANRALTLANLVADKAKRVFETQDRTKQEQVLAVIVDAANAVDNEVEHFTWLGKRFEQLAFGCSTSEQASLISGVIRHLHEAHPRCRPYLSRARAAAELFRNRRSAIT